MNEQLPLPGVPPAEQASPEDTAEVTLLFETDDRVSIRIINVIRDLFFPALTHSTQRINAAANARHLGLSLLNACSHDAKNLVREVMREEIEAQVAAQMQKALRDLRHAAKMGAPKGPRK